MADGYFQQAKDRFKSYANLELLHGDSCVLIPSVVSKLTAPDLFWLDGHYSGADTVRGELDTSVSAKLQAILTHLCKAHVVCIDDVRCFDGSNGYSYLDDLLKAVREKSNYCAEVYTDIIRLIPTL